MSSELSDNEEVGRTAGVIHISKHTRKHTTSSQTHESEVVEEEEDLEATIVVEEPVKGFAKWPTKSLEDKLLKTLGAKDSSERRVYIATCEKLFPGLVKVGEAANVIGRLGSLQEHWGAEFRCLWQSEEPFYGAHRVEQLILAEFRGERVSRKCVSTKCRKSHTEFLTTEPETVKAAAKCWERWLKEGRPYEDTMLNARWTNIIKAMVTKNRVPTAQNLIESLDQDDQLCDSPSHEEQLTNTSTHGPRQLAPKIPATTPTDRSSSTSTSPSPDPSIQQRMTSSISRILTEFVDDDSPFYDCSTITAVEDEASAGDSAFSKLSQEVSEDAASPLLSIPGAFPSDPQDSVDAFASDKYLRTRLQAKHVHSGAKCLPLRNSSQSET